VTSAPTPPPARPGPARPTAPPAAKHAPPPPAEPRPRHTTSAYGGAQITAASYRPHQDGPVLTATVGGNPDAPAQRQAAPEISPTVPYAGGSPTGYDPYTQGTY